MIEDEVGISDFVRRGLESAGFTVLVAADGLSGLQLAQHEDVEFDLGLPGLPGEQVLTRLRSVRPALPVIVLMAKGAISDRVTNLEAGANGYVVKPFSLSELLARVRVQLRRQLDRLRQIVDDLSALNAGGDRTGVEISLVFAADVVQALRDGCDGIGLHQRRGSRRTAGNRTGQEGRLMQALLAS